MAINKATGQDDDSDRVILVKPPVDPEADVEPSDKGVRDISSAIANSADNKHSK